MKKILTGSLLTASQHTRKYPSKIQKIRRGYTIIADGFGKLPHDGYTSAAKQPGYCHCGSLIAVKLAIAAIVAVCEKRRTNSLTAKKAPSTAAYI